MKKVLYLLFILLFAACQYKMISTKAVYVPVVTTPHNSGLGDPLATAFEKVNAGFVDVYATFLLKTPIDHLGTVDIDFVGFFNAAGDSMPPYIPVAYRSPFTITSDGGYFRVFENGVELKFPAYSPIYETNYYVKTGGDDTKTGLSDADAWAHHP